MGFSRDRRRRESPPDEHGSDPSVFFGPPKAARDDRSERKTRQLCREVERTLAVALSSSRDALVRNLMVMAIDPAPDGSRLCVTLCPTGALDVDVVELLAHLGELRGFLRREIAQALQRKRTPELAFVIAPPPATPPDMPSETPSETPPNMPRETEATK
jgi:ribosome-binding factor A